jgi:hypothetical protein
VLGSRSQLTLASNWRGFGSFFFCAEDCCSGPGFGTAAELGRTRTSTNATVKLLRHATTVDAITLSGRLARGGYPGIPDSIEIKIAERFFDWAVFRFLQAFGELARENIFLGFFGFHGCAEFCLDGFCLLAQEPCRIIEINRGRRFRRRDVRKHNSEFPIQGELRMTTGAIRFKGLFALARHGAILRQFEASGTAGQ